MNPTHLSSVFSGLSSEHKFQKYRELWSMAKDYKILTDFPLHLDIELSGVCNLRCSLCFQNGLIDGPLGLMDVDLYKKIIDDSVTNGLCAIKLQNRGESFLHPHIFECIRYAKDQNVLDVQITTNATLLDDKNIEGIINSGLDCIIFSVDSHHENSYSEKNRQRQYLSIDNAIKSLMTLRNHYKKKHPWVRIQSSIHQSDPKTIQKVKTHLNQRFPDADLIVVNRIHNFRDDTDAFPDLNINYYLDPCAHLMQRLAILWDGEVTTCCGDYNNKFKLGNLKDTSIQRIWLSNKMMKFREIHKTNQRRTMPICKHCQASLTAKTDEVMIDTTNRHIADQPNI